MGGKCKRCLGVPFCIFDESEDIFYVIICYFVIEGCIKWTERAVDAPQGYLIVRNIVGLDSLLAWVKEEEALTMYERKNL